MPVLPQLCLGSRHKPPSPEPRLSKDETSTPSPGGTSMSTLRGHVYWKDTPINSLGGRLHNNMSEGKLEVIPSS